MNLATFRASVAQLIRDAAGVLQQADLDFAIGEAVRRYSRVRPRVVVADVVGSGSFDYDLPAGWDVTFSRMQSVEYPAGRREASYVDKLDYSIYNAPASQKLRFLVDTPQAGESVRITFTALHTIT